MTFTPFPIGMSIEMCYIHCVAKVYAVLPFYDVNAYVPEGRNEGGRKATPTSISIFDFFDIKTL